MQREIAKSPIFGISRFWIFLVFWFFKAPILGHQCRISENTDFPTNLKNDFPKQAYKSLKNGYKEGKRGKILPEALLRSREDLIKGVGPLRSLKG